MLLFCILNIIISTLEHGVYVNNEKDFYFETHITKEEFYIALFNTFLICHIKVIIALLSLIMKHSLILSREIIYIFYLMSKYLYLNLILII